MTPIRSIVRPQRLTRVVAVLAFGFVLAVAVGCGDKAEVPLLKVAGTVKAGGAPMPLGTVTFHPDAGKGNASKSTTSGNIKADGTYVLLTDGKEGAAAGWYNVTVSGQGMPDPSKMTEPGKMPTAPVVNAKYTKPETSGFSIEVKDGAAAGAYDLSLVK